MNRNEKKYLDYVSILHEELRPAMGCTEPIAIAYAAAKARSVLGALPDKVKIEVSGNIIKNVKSVVVPHTGGLRGIPAAAAAGIVAGDENAELEVLSNVQDSQNIEMKEYLERTPIEVLYAETPHIFDIMITVYTGEETAFVRIVDYHTNMVTIKKNDQVILEKELSDAPIGSEGLTFLKGGRYTEIAHTIVNVLAVDSGIICDGAKASCAAKISTAVEAGLLGMAMFEDGNQFFAGDGIVKKGVENTIRSIGYLARRGMEQTDKEIIKIMMEN